MQDQFDVIDSKHHSKLESIRLMLTLGLLTLLVPFSMDTYLPAFDAMVKDLSLTMGELQLSITVFSLAMAVGQLIYGPFVDKYGRRIPLLLSIIIGVVASVGITYFADNLYSLLVLRVLQAVGYGAGAVVARTILVDLFPPKVAVKYFGYLILILSVSPLLAPSLGAFLITYFDWSVIFLFLAVIGVAAVLAIVFVLPPTRPGNPNFKLSRTFHVYFDLLKNRPFMRLILLSSAQGGIVLAALTSASAIYLNEYGVSPSYMGMLFPVLVVGMLIAPQFNPLLHRSLRMTQVVRLAAIGAFVMGGILAAIALYGVPVLVFTISFSAVGFFVSLLNTNASALALAEIKEHVGSASSILGFSILGIGFLSSVAYNLLSHLTSFSATQSLMALVLFFVVMIMLFAWAAPLHSKAEDHR